MKQGLKINTRQIVAGRVLKGWTQADLARAIKVDPATICRLETGKHLRPGTLYSVCRELGIEVETVLEEKK